MFFFGFWFLVVSHVCAPCVIRQYIVIIIYSLVYVKSMLDSQGNIDKLIVFEWFGCECGFVFLSFVFMFTFTFTFSMAKFIIVKCII